jgi:hypothetical protein
MMMMGKQAEKYIGLCVKRPNFLTDFNKTYTIIGNVHSVTLLRYHKNPNLKLRYCEKVLRSSCKVPLSMAGSQKYL